MLQKITFINISKMKHNVEKLKMPFKDTSANVVLLYFKDPKVYFLELVVQVKRLPLARIVLLH